MLLYRNVLTQLCILSAGSREVHDPDGAKPRRLFVIGSGINGVSSGAFKAGELIEGIYAWHVQTAGFCFDWECEEETVNRREINVDELGPHMASMELPGMLNALNADLLIAFRDCSKDASDILIEKNINMALFGFYDALVEQVDTKKAHGPMHCGIREWGESTKHPLPPQYMEDNITVFRRGQRYLSALPKAPPVDVQTVEFTEEVTPRLTSVQIAVFKHVDLTDNVTRGAYVRWAQDHIRKAFEGELAEWRQDDLRLYVTGVLERDHRGINETVFLIMRSLYDQILLPYIADDFSRESGIRFILIVTGLLTTGALILSSFRLWDLRTEALKNMQQNMDQLESVASGHVHAIEMSAMNIFRRGPKVYESDY